MEKTTCTVAKHEALKMNPAEFARLFPVGQMADLVDDEYPVRLDTYQLSNCRCGSTLARLIDSTVLSGSTVLS